MKKSLLAVLSISLLYGCAGSNNKTIEQPNAVIIPYEVAIRQATKVHFFKLCTSSPPDLLKEIQYVIEGKSEGYLMNYNIENAQKLYQDYIKTLEENKLLAEKDESIFLSEKDIIVPEKCDTKEKYLKVISNKRNKIEAEYKILNNIGAKGVKENLEYLNHVFEEFSPEHTMYTFTLNKVVEENGIAEGEKFIFIGNRYKGWQRPFILLYLKFIKEKIIFTSIEDLELQMRSGYYTVDKPILFGSKQEKSFNADLFKTFIYKIDLDTIIVKGAYNQSWSLFILKRPPGLSLTVGQNLDEYAFKIIGTKQYKGQDFALVELVK